MADLTITLKKSMIGFEKSQGLTARALGLGKVGSSVTQPDNGCVRGMIHKISHVLLVESDGSVVSTPPVRTPKKRAHGPHHGYGPGVKR